MNPSAKAKVLQALNRVKERLEAPDPFDDLSRLVLRMTVEYAIEQVEQIQELKRKRRDKTVASVPETP